MGGEVIFMPPALSSLDYLIHNQENHSERNKQGGMK
jgi:hypothetical protein